MTKNNRTKQRVRLRSYDRNTALDLSVTSYRDLKLVFLGSDPRPQLLSWFYKTFKPPLTQRMHENMNTIKQEQSIQKKVKNLF